jgi:hypothetical protein
MVADFARRLDAAELERAGWRRTSRPRRRGLIRILLGQ